MPAINLNQGVPPDFVFNQTNLQDYVDCPRRFQLAHVVELAWPAVETAPVKEMEQRIYFGKIFHLLVQQNQLGIPTEVLNEYASEEPLSSWWQNYLHDDPAKGPGDNFVEMTFSVEILGHTLIAKYDLLKLRPERKATIFDWKTGGRLPRREWLQARLQTRVYPVVLAGMDDYLTDYKPILAGDIDMVYWFAGARGETVRFEYSPEQFEQDRFYLVKLIEEIKTYGDHPFPLTVDTTKCLYCRYRSLCDRGQKPGSELDFSDADQAAEDDMSLDFEQIAEIEF